MYPDEHLVQAEAPASEKYAGEHCWQSVTYPLACQLAVPAGHEVQVMGSTLTYPLGHTQYWDVASGAVPAEQVTQAVAPVVAANLPASHVVQVDAEDLAWNVPAGHAMQLLPQYCSTVYVPSS